MNKGNANKTSPNFVISRKYIVRSRQPRRINNIKTTELDSQSESLPFTQMSSKPFESNNSTFEKNVQSFSQVINSYPNERNAVNKPLNGQMHGNIQKNSQISSKTELNKDLKMTAKNSPHMGGDVYISTGQGAISDGSMYLQIGKETALTINNRQFIVEDKDLIVSNGKLFVTEMFSQVNSTVAVSEDNNMVAKVNGNHTVIKVVSDFNGIVLPLTIHNNVITAHSFVNLTCHTNGEGIPHAWISEISSGKMVVKLSTLNNTVASELYMHVYIHNAA